MSKESRSRKKTGTTHEQKSLCLAMIVKDESAVIERCLERVKPHIDYWVITDTGSSDNTKELIAQQLASIPGELHDVPWDNFGYNRSKLMELSYGKSDYLLLVDADEGFTVHKSNFKSRLTADSYLIRYTGDFFYRQKLLVKADCHWQYSGVTHEFINSDDEKTSEVNDDISFVDFADGSRHSEKYEDDIVLLKQGLIDEPDNERYLFYLARSYYDVQDYEQALVYYEKRIAAGGWEEEVYVSMLGKAKCLSKINDRFMCDAFVEAYEFRPSRLEALCKVIEHYRQKNMYHFAYLLCKQGIKTPFPKDDILFVDKGISDYGLLDELAVCAYWVGQYQETERLCRGLLRNVHVPDSWKPRIEENLQYARKKLHEQQ